MGPMSTQRSQRLGTVACKSHIHPCPHDHTTEERDDSRKGGCSVTVETTGSQLTGTVTL